MSALALIPGLIALIVGLRRSAQVALLNVYLPVLILMPEYYRWRVPLLPKVTPSHAAIIGVIIVALIRKQLKWRFSFTDVLMIALAAGMSISEYTNAGYKEAQNLTFDMLGWLVLPYLATKALVEPLGLRVLFARRIAFLMFVVSVISLYEFRLGRTLFRLPFDPFFPGQGTGWVTTFRYGFARVAGPYGHAILAGVILLVGYRIQKWLASHDHWEPHFRRFRFKYSKARVITVGITAGCVMTMCRGPWMGGAVAAIVYGVSRARNRQLAINIALACLVVIGVPAALAFRAYVSVGRAHATSVNQETAAYRKELMDQYTDIALRKSFIGWGRNTWPKVRGMESIDNYYLQLTLMHGLLALSLFVTIIISMMIRLGRFGARLTTLDPEASSLAFTFLSIYALIAFSIATVYLGTQLMPLLAVVTGWSEGLLITPHARADQTTASIRGPSLEFQFGRVVT